jgi:hypothetical protein
MRRITGAHLIARDNGTMQRVVVAGCAGSGKSTLARELAARTGLPLTERDGLGVLGSPQYKSAISQMAAGSRWILDGAPYYADEMVYSASSGTLTGICTTSGICTSAGNSADRKAINSRSITPSGTPSLDHRSRMKLTGAGRRPGGSRWSWP